MLVRRESDRTDRLFSYRQLAASLRSGFKTRLNGLFALLMRGGAERRGQLQYHHYYRYNQEEEEEEQLSGSSKVAGTVV